MEEEVMIQSSVSQEIANIKTDMSNFQVRLALAESNINDINKKLDKIDANVSKLIWIIAAAIIGAVLRTSGII